MSESQAPAPEKDLKEVYVVLRKVEHGGAEPVAAFRDAYSADAHAFDLYRDRERQDVEFPICRVPLLASDP